MNKASRLVAWVGVFALLLPLSGCTTAPHKEGVPGNAEKLREFLDRGVGANTQEVADAYVNSAGAGQQQFVELLLHRGVDLESRGTCDTSRTAWMKESGSFSGVTALMCAAANGETQIVGLLLQRGADANANAQEFRKKWTALHFAVFFDHSQVAKQLLDSGAEDVRGPLALAREVDRSSGMIHLLEQAAELQLGTERK